MVCESGIYKRLLILFGEKVLASNLTRVRDLTVKCQILLTFHLTVNLTLNSQMLNLTGSGETGNRPSFDWLIKVW